MPAHHLHHGRRDVQSDILSCRLNDIPPAPSRTVKIYVCSNQSDFVVERRALWSQALPELHMCCLHYGLDLELVDVHHGNDLDHVLDSHAFHRHLRELQHCSHLSQGPFFLCLLGNKYGKPPLPLYLDLKEFVHIRNEAFESGKEIKLLDEWYTKDENAVPPVYRLVPISHRFPHYNSRDADKVTEREKDVSGWIEVYRDLLDLIQHGASEAFKEGLINQVHHQKQERFFLSGIEQELQKALEKSVKGCVCIMRKFDNLNTENEMAGSYTDLQRNGQLDLGAQKSVQSMREYVSSKLNDRNKHTFKIGWCENGVAPHLLDTHYDYLDDFNAAVVTKLKVLIEHSAKHGRMHTPSSLHIIQHHSSGSKEKLSAEVFPHVSHCRELGTAFVPDGFECEIEELRKVLITGSCMDHSAVLILGPKSCGLSSLLGHLSLKLIPEILGKEVIIIPRFMDVGDGASKECHLQSISHQIYTLLGVEVDFLSGNSDLLKSSYPNLLQCLSSKSGQLVIFLDGLSAPKDVSDLEDSFTWLPCQLPPRVHVILSFTETSNNSIGVKLLNKNGTKYNIVHVKHRTLEQFTSCVGAILAIAKRTIQPEQKNVLISCASGDPSLHHLSYVSQQLKGCVSRDDVNHVQALIGKSYQESVIKLFASLEQKHGKVFVSRIAQYVTLARNGLTEMELQDLLSLNDDTLLAAHPQELPPILRFPVSLWIDIKSDLGPLLLTRCSDMKRVLYWRDQTISQVARQRYLQQPRVAREAHKHIAELFLESWIDNKPLVCKDRSVQRLDNGNRLLCPQPLLYSETRYNMRRINELCHHLLHAGEQESFRDFGFCNFEYLLATAHSTSMENLFRSLEVSMSRLLDAEVNLVLSALKLSRDVLLEDPLQLANELIGRLRQLKEFYPQSIESLVTQCMQWCDSYSLPLIVPLTAWLPDPRKPIITMLEVGEAMTRVLPTQNCQHILCATESTAVQMYHVPSRKLVITFKGHAGPVLCMCVTHSRTVLLTGAEDATIRVWDLFTAHCNTVISEHDSAVLSVTVSPDDSMVVSGSRDRTVLVYSLAESRVLHRLREHTSPVTGVVYNTTGSILVTAGLDKKMLLWYTEDMTVMNTITRDIASPITCLALSVDNTFLLIACEAGTVHVYSFTTGTEVHQLRGHKGKVSSLAVSSDCVHAVIGCHLGGVYIYNLCTTELLRTLTGSHHSPVLSVSVAASRNLIFTATKKKVCVWNMYSELTREVVDDNHIGPITAIAINPAGKLAVTGGQDGLLKVWNLDLSVFTESLVGHAGAVTCLALEGEEGRVLSGSYDTTVKVWSISMATITTDYKCHQSPVRCVYVLTDGSRVMSLDQEDRLKLWLMDTGQTLFSYTEPIPVLGVSPNSHIVFSASGSNSVKLWLLEDSSVIQTISHKGEITCVTCTQDSEFVVTGSDDMSLKVWEARTGKLTQVLVEHRGSVSCVTTTQNSCNIISGSHDSNLIIWNLATGSVEHLMEGHQGVVTVLRVTTDGSILISGSRDGTLRVWNISHGKQLTLFDMHHEVEDIAMTFDASNIVVRLAGHSHAPLLCLHNTPATEVKSESQVSIQMVNSVSGDSLPLPLKPHRPLIHYPLSVFPVPKATKFKRRESRFSVSSMPEIIQVSPIKAPVQTAIMAQERKKEKKPKVKKIQRKQENEDDKPKSKSGICVLL